MQTKLQKGQLCGAFNLLSRASRKGTACGTGEGAYQLLQTLQYLWNLNLSAVRRLQLAEALLQGLHGCCTCSYR